MKHFLGIDIGGTKSHAAIADETGRIRGFGAGGAGNHESVGYDGLRRVLEQITAAALQQSGLQAADIAGAGFGVAGYDWPSERQATEHAIAGLGLKCPYAVVNDTVIGLLAGAAEGWGVGIVAGTGENCWGRAPDGRIGRVTGNGPLMAEFGGASTLVMKAVQAVSLAWSRRGPQTKLAGVFQDFTGAASQDELLEGLALGRYPIDAGCAPLVVGTAEKGDPVAGDILAWAGAQLADLGLGVIRQLELAERSFDVVLVGGMFKSSPLLCEALEARIRAEAPGARIVPLEAPPVIGGVLLGMEAAGAPRWQVRQKLIEGMRGISW